MNTRKQGGGTILGMFIGLVVGVLIAAGVVWYLNKTPLPFQEKGTRPTTEKNGEARPAAVPVAPEPLPGKPGDKVTEKPRFEFYKILPGSQEPVPQAEPKPAAAAPKPAGDALFLQAGSFQNPADADNLKARLALMGVEASVQKVEVPDKGTMHRVRVGPYMGQDVMTKAREQLSASGISTAVVKIKPKEPKPVPAPQ